MVDASRPYTRLIVRRPHAYELARQVEGTPIPGILVLTPDRKLLGSFELDRNALRNPEAASGLADLLTRHARSPR